MQCAACVRASLSDVASRETEYSFGHSPDPGTGVFEVRPREAEGCRFRRALLMGQTEKTSQEIQRVIDQMSSEYPARGYHVRCCARCAAPRDRCC